MFIYTILTRFGIVPDFLNAIERNVSNWSFVVNLTEEQTALLKKVVDEGRLAEHMEKHYNVFHDLMIEGKLSPEKIVAIIFDFFVGGINSVII